MLNALLPSLTDLSARAIPLVLATAVAVELPAQNLVVNGSFEDTVNCDIPTQCTLLKASHWYNPTTSTPDLYDQDQDRQCGYIIPTEGMVYMPPEDGTRMAGAFFWDGPFGGPTRDYLATRLTGDLIAGASYEVRLWYTRNRLFQSAVDHIGVWFGSDSLFEPTYGPLSVVPQVKLRDPNSQYLVDGDDWTQLVDTFTAQGGERWMAIGNFDPQDSLHGIVADPSAAASNCYYYLDNVELRELPMVHVPEVDLPSVHWTIGGMAIHWNAKQGPVAVEVLDAAGRLVQGRTIGFVQGRGFLSMEALPKGLYLLRLHSGHKAAVVKFVKEEGE
jgi:hypothetical protein